MSELDRAEIALFNVTPQEIEHFTHRSGLILDRTLDVKEFHDSNYAKEISSGLIPPTSRRFIHNAQCDSCSLNARTRMNLLFEIE